MGTRVESRSSWAVTQEAVSRFDQLVYGTADTSVTEVSPCILLHNMLGGKIVDIQFPPHNNKVRGENEIEVIRPLQVGDEIRASTLVISVEPKVGKSGEMIVLRGETWYLDSKASLVLISRATIIFR